MLEKYKTLGDAEYLKRLESLSSLPAYVSFWESNKKFQKYNSFLMGLIKIQILVIITITIAFYFYVSQEIPSDRFFIVHGESQSNEIVGMYRPNNSRDTLAMWVSDAIVDIMTFGFNDYEERFGISKNHFTKKGWEAFRKTVISTGFIRDIEDNKQILTSAPSSFPILLKDGIIDGSFQWVYSVELLITYRSGASQSNSVRKATVFVERIPTSENPKGVGISSLIL